MAKNRVEDGRLVRPPGYWYYSDVVVELVGRRILERLGVGDRPRLRLRLREDLQMGEIEIAELMLDLGNELDLNVIPMGDVSPLRTVDDVVLHVRAVQKEKALAQN